MKEQSQLTISHLKAHLSDILHKVRRGMTFVVVDRKTPIARIVGLTSSPLTRLSAPEGAFSLPEMIKVTTETDPVSLLLEDRGRR